MTQPEADVLIVDDQPYSSGGSDNEDYEPIQNEKDQIEPVVENQEIEKETKKKKAKKPTEPIFIPVISGTATLDSDRADTEINVNNNISNTTKTTTKTKELKKEDSNEANVKEKSKCCLLI